MKKLLLITFILLLKSFPSFGDLKGKSLICKCKFMEISEGTKTKKCDVLNNNYVDTKDRFSYLYKFYNFIKFDDENLTFSSLLRKKDSFYFKEKKLKYTTSIPFIAFLDDNTIHMIRRKTLGMYSEIIDGPIYYYNCKLFNDLKSFAYEKDMLLGEVQNKYNLSLKENKL